MNELEIMIKAMLEEGKTDKEISKAVLAHDDGKELKTNEIVAKILLAKKEADVEAELDKEADKTAEEEKIAEAETEAEKKLNKKFDERLKEIKGLGVGGFSVGNAELKRFNPSTGELEAVVKPSDAYKTANDMFIALAEGDVPKAKGLSEEIEQDNVKMRKLYGQKAANDPIRSDSDAAGGYAVPAETDESITQMLYAQSIMLQKAKTDNVQAGSKIYPTMYGSAIAYVADQNTDITEEQFTFTNPTVSMHRIAGYSNISNTIIRQRADIVGAVQADYASKLAAFIDLHSVCGNVSGQSHLVDGIMFDTNTAKDTAIALTNLDVDDIQTMLENISMSSSNLALFCNRKVAGQLGLSENTGGQYTFPQYVAGGSLAPMGVPLYVNPQIISTLDIGGDDWGGSDDAIALVDLDKFIIGVSGETRFDISKDWRFGSDETTFRGIRDFGCKVLISTTVSTGASARVLELTN